MLKLQRNQRNISKIQVIYYKLKIIINNKMLDIFEVNCIIYNMYVLNSSKATRL